VQIRYLVSKGCIKPLCDLLDTSDPRIVAVALEALENILEKGNMEDEEENSYALIIEDSNGCDLIEKLQLHANQSIADKAAHIISKFFSQESEEESDDDNIAPVSSANSFQFGQQGNNNAPFNFN